MVCNCLRHLVVSIQFSNLDSVRVETRVYRLYTTVLSWRWWCVPLCFVVEFVALVRF